MKYIKMKNQKNKRNRKNQYAQCAAQTLTFAALAVGGADALAATVTADVTFGVNPGGAVTIAATGQLANGDGVYWNTTAVPPVATEFLHGSSWANYNIKLPEAQRSPNGVLAIFVGDQNVSYASGDVTNAANFYWRSNVLAVGADASKTVTFGTGLALNKNVWRVGSVGSVLVAPATLAPDNGVTVVLDASQNSDYASQAGMLLPPLPNLTYAANKMDKGSALIFDGAVPNTGSVYTTKAATANGTPAPFNNKGARNIYSALKGVTLTGAAGTTAIAFINMAEKNSDIVGNRPDGSWTMGTGVTVNTDIPGGNVPGITFAATSAPGAAIRGLVASVDLKVDITNNEKATINAQSWGANNALGLILAHPAQQMLEMNFFRNAEMAVGTYAGYAGIGMGSVLTAVTANAPQGVAQHYAGYTKIHVTKITGDVWSVKEATGTLEITQYAANALITGDALLGGGTTIFNLYTGTTRLATGSLIINNKTTINAAAAANVTLPYINLYNSTRVTVLGNAAHTVAEYVNDDPAFARANYSTGNGPILKVDLDISAVTPNSFLDEGTFKLNRPSFAGDANVRLKGVQLVQGSYASAGSVNDGLNPVTGFISSGIFRYTGGPDAANIASVTWTLAGSAVAGSDFSTAILVVPNTNALDQTKIGVSANKHGTLVVEGMRGAAAPPFTYTQPNNHGTLSLVLRHSAAGGAFTEVGDITLNNASSSITFVGYSGADITASTTAANVSAGTIRFVGSGNAKVTGTFAANATKVGSSAFGLATTGPIDLNATIIGTASLGELSFITDPTNPNRQTLTLNVTGAITNLYSGSSQVSAGSLVANAAITLAAGKNIAGLAIRTKSDIDINGIVQDVADNPLLIAPQNFDVAAFTTYASQGIAGLTAAANDLKKLQPPKIVGEVKLYNPDSQVVAVSIVGPITSAGRVFVINDFAAATPVLNVTGGLFIAPLSELKGDVELSGGKLVLRKITGKLEVSGGQSYVVEGVKGIIKVSNDGQAFFASSVPEATLEGASSTLGFVSATATAPTTALTLQKLNLPAAGADKSYSGVLTVQGVKFESTGAIGAITQDSKVSGLSALNLDAAQAQFNQTTVVANVQVSGTQQSTLILAGNKNLKAREYVNYAFGNFTSAKEYTGPQKLNVQVSGAASLITGAAIADPIANATVLPLAIDMANASLLKINSDLPAGSTISTSDTKNQVELCIVASGEANISTSIGASAKPLTVISIESGANPANVTLGKAYADLVQLDSNARLHFSVDSFFTHVVPNTDSAGGTVVLNNITPIVSTCNFGAGAGRTLSKIVLVGHEDVELKGAVVAEQLSYEPLRDVNVATTLTLRSAQIGDCDVISSADNEFYLNLVTSQEMIGDVSIKKGGIMINDGTQLVIKTSNLEVPLIASNKDGTGVVVFDQKNIDFNKSDTKIAVQQFGKADKRLGTLIIKTDELVAGHPIGNAKINVKNLVIDVPRSVVLSGEEVIVDTAEIRGSSLVHIDALRISGTFAVAEGAKTSITFGGIENNANEKENPASKTCSISGKFGTANAAFERMTFAHGAQNIISGAFYATELAMANRHFVLSNATTISGLMNISGVTTIDLERHALTMQNAESKPTDVLTLGLTLVNTDSFGSIIAATGSTLDLSELEKLVINVKVEDGAATSKLGTEWLVLSVKDGGKITFPASNKIDLKVLNNIVGMRFAAKGGNGLLILDKSGSNPVSPITEEEKKVVKEAIDKALGSSAQILADDLLARVYKEAVSDPNSGSAQLVNTLHAVMQNKNLSQEQKDETVAVVMTQFAYTGAGQANQSSIANLSMMIDNTSLMSGTGSVVAFDEGRIGVSAGDDGNRRGSSAWIKPLYGTSKQRSYVNDPIGYRSSQAGILVGFDKNVSDQLLMGMSVGYIALDTKPNAKVVEGAKTDASNFMGSLYAKYDLCPEVTLSGLVGYSAAFNKGVSPRTVLVKESIVQEYANYKYNSNNVALQLKGQYNIASGSHEWTPYISAGLLSLGKIAYLETDTSNNRNVQTKAATMFQGALGGNYTNTVSNVSGLFKSGAFAQLVFFSKNHSQTSVQYDGGTPVVLPAPLNQNIMYSVGFIFDAQLKSGLDVGLNIGMQGAKKYIGGNVQITARVNF
ncbi:autotransporter outer membrane beta-barrel domain-containing protein [Candidatus Sarmatiella mevalonica]|uniref:autotransporter outer membrane beta-barrel domain-containing protein n=1 Tax=Candidatus Sarmatiella mevalonica TaxID=2770581 RepID=UPI001921C77C|nr:autotransporter outer membrane beta-barrel domain-containing protein [Candidatus Sarmatiella mevalonica]